MAKIENSNKSSEQVRKESDDLNTFGKNLLKMDVATLTLEQRVRRLENLLAGRDLWEGK